MSKKISLLVKELKNEEQDFEWYPTTNEILDVAKSHSQKILGENYHEEGKKVFSVLDIGAGDGRGAEALANGGMKYYIEKSPILINELPADFIPAGTDFLRSNIMTCDVDIVFSNPPYRKSEGFEGWASKIISEANCKIIYLVMPERWESSSRINAALKRRNTVAEVLGEFGFLEADRKARGTSNLVFVDLCRYPDGYRKILKRGRTNFPTTDPFSIWMEETFSFSSDNVGNENGISEANIKIKDVVSTGDYVKALVELYNNDLRKLQDTLKNIENLPALALDLLGANHTHLKKAINESLKTLKKTYWSELFDRYKPITSKLTCESRRKMKEKLTSRNAIDFTMENIYAITAWACKNANNYIDEQLIAVYDGLIDAGSVKLFKSNRFEEDNWWWNCNKRKVGPYRRQIEYRICLERNGHVTGVSSNDHPKGLQKKGHDLINDLITISRNLGFRAIDGDSYSFDWEPGRKYELKYNDGKTFMFVKGFKKGSLHIWLDIEFQKVLAVKFSLLMGWIKNSKEAAEEINEVSVDEADRIIKINQYLDFSKVLRLTI